VKKLLGIAVFVCFAAAAMAIVIPKGTDLRLAFDEALSSKTSKIGDKVNLHVVEDVLVGDQVVIKKGTVAVGTITEVNKGRHFGVNATMKLRLDPIVAADNSTKIEISPRYKGKKTGEKSDKAALAAAGGAVVLGPIGLGIGYFITGKNVTVKVGDTLTTEVSKEVELTSAAPSGVQNTGKAAGGS
jgi:hypothetical protein